MRLLLFEHGLFIKDLCWSLIHFFDVYPRRQFLQIIDLKFLLELTRFIIFYLLLGLLSILLRNLYFLTFFLFFQIEVLLESNDWIVELNPKNSRNAYTSHCKKRKRTHNKNRDIWDCLNWKFLQKTSDFPIPKFVQSDSALTFTFQS